MHKDNIYYAARAEASKHDKLLANRERAADALHVSSVALAGYETGQVVPPCDVVQWMIDVYHAPGLKGKHMRAVCPLMTEGAPEYSELARAALGWITAIGSAESLGREFASVALDGTIDAAEVTAALAIRRKAVELTRVMQETIAAIDTALGRMERD